ncbi:MAG: replicative DNA helicase [Verrucomicrobiae bacterium]|nr:replicative DNA helicase [Verrucomicrobiae bacterium]
MAAPSSIATDSTRHLVERVLPNSSEAEMAVLGAILLSPQDVAPVVVDRLREEHFYHVAHQVIFREIRALYDATRGVDTVTLTQRLQDKNLLDEVGGAVYIADLAAHVPTLANLEHYLDIIEEKYLLRRLITAAHDIITHSYERQDDVRNWVDEVERRLFEITAERASKGVVHIKDIIRDAMQSIDRLFETRGMTGLPTGFRDLDRLTSGLHPGTMFVIAARPSMGKTSLALNIAEHVALDQGLPVGIFSLEMSAEELVKRMLCSRARVNLHAIRDGFLSEQRDFVPLTNAASELMKAPVYIDDTAGLSIHQVRARARRLKMQHNIQLLVIDYLQLMRAPSRRAETSRQVEISDISGGVKALAKELQIPIIVLSQLNRQPDQREEGRPKLSDLRESGAIEQDADIVGLLVRPELYAETDEERAERRGEAKLIIAKQRNGPTGEVDLTFLAEYTRFENAASISEEDVPAIRGDE